MQRIFLPVDYIVWKKDYSVGLSLLDAEHKEIFATINELYAELESNKDSSKFKLLMDRAVEYANKHFNDEEKIMTEVNFPDLKNHRKTHETYKQKIDKLVQICRRDSISNTAHELLLYLKDWWKHHVTSVDKAYSPYVAGKK